MMIFAYFHSVTVDTTKHVISMFLLLSSIIFGLSILPSASIILEFGCELGDPVSPASCNTIMISLANVCSIVGVLVTA